MFFTSLSAFSQGNNPVRISIIGNGSYSNNIADYCSDINAGMIKLTVQCADLNETNIPIQFFVSISDLSRNPYILTKSPNIAPPITIYSGDAPKILTGSDLKCLFDPMYLTGNKLKDGNNTLKIYARDARTGKIVSNTATILLKPFKIKQPRLKQPEDNFVYEQLNDRILFEWNEDNAHSYKMLRYCFKLEIWQAPINGIPYETYSYTNPLLTFDNIYDTKYELTQCDAYFKIGQKYIWRVTAYDPFALNKYTFEQNGKSAINCFTYKHLPVEITGLRHVVDSTRRTTQFFWDKAEGQTKYYVEYYNPQTNDTIHFETFEPQFKLAKAPYHEYKIYFRVKAQCWNDDNRQSQYTPWDTIKFEEPKPIDPKYSCGQTFKREEITNKTLKTVFEKGEIVKEPDGSADYEMIYCQADANGVLQGKFFVIMNCWGGGKILCKFHDTKINTDNIVLTTRFKSEDIPGGMVDPEEIKKYYEELITNVHSVLTSTKIKDTVKISEKFSLQECMRHSYHSLYYLKQ